MSNHIATIPCRYEDGTEDEVAIYLSIIETRHGAFPGWKTAYRANGDHVNFLVEERIFETLEGKKLIPDDPSLVPL